MAESVEYSTEAVEASSSVFVAEAVEAFHGLETVASRVDVRSCSPEQLQQLTGGVRQGQRALDLLLIRVGVAAAAHDDEGRGRGAQATMLGDGSDVRGHTARREADRAKTATKMSVVAVAVDDGRIGAPHIDAIAQAAKGLSPEQQDRLNNEELIESAETLPVDVFARRVRHEAKRIKGDYGLADTKARQARSSWKHWFDERSGTGRIQRHPISLLERHTNF